MNFKRKLLLLLAFFITIFPYNVLALPKYVIPGGENIGINIKTNGVYVVGFYPVDNQKIAYNQGIKVGDKIVGINNHLINDIKSMSRLINQTDDIIFVKLNIIRNEKPKTITLKLKKDKSGSYKTGMYVKDAISGIGTITFITLDNKYGALGHEIIESTTNERFKVRQGEIYSSNITGIEKSNKGKPGEKNAKIFYDKVLGTITHNFETGIFGRYQGNINKNEMMPVASIEEVKLGKAEIVTVLQDNVKKRYTIEILLIDKESNTKNYKIELTDKRLLSETGGIIKGMSGSPIIQNEKIIGAVTHALVNDPKIGYGINIEKMLKSVE